MVYTSKQVRARAADVRWNFLKRRGLRMSDLSAPARDALVAWSQAVARLERCDELGHEGLRVTVAYQNSEMRLRRELERLLEQETEPDDMVARMIREERLAAHETR